MKKKYDDQSNRERQRFISKKSKKVTNTVRESFVEWDTTNGVVLEIFPKFAKVRIDATGNELLCTYRRANVWQSKDEAERDRSPLVVGDRVLAQIFGSKDGVIQGVAKRKNAIARPAPGRDSISHVLAANLDYMVIITSIQDPEFSPRFVDRFLIGAQKAAITPILCINKVDLNPRPDSTAWKPYEDLGIECILVSAKDRLGLKTLEEKITGKAVMFCGHSGVGKTSLLNALLSSYQGKTGDVNTFTGKGKHTTTSAKMLQGPMGSAWIDTPGIRSFSVENIDEKELRFFFPEFEKIECSNRNCIHDEHAENCQAKTLIRYSSYLKMLQDIREAV